MTGVHRWPCSTGRGYGQHSPLETHNMDIRPSSHQGPLGSLRRLPSLCLPQPTYPVSQGSHHQVRRPELVQLCHGRKGAADRGPREHPKCVSGSGQLCCHSRRQRPRPAAGRETHQWRQLGMPALAEWRVGCILVSYCSSVHCALDMGTARTWPSWLSARVEISWGWPHQCRWVPECRSSTTTRRPHV